MVVAAASTTPNLKATPTLRSQSNPKRRPPLLPSERENNNNVAVAAAAANRRPKSREVNSRYLSTSSSSSTTSGTSSSSTFSNSSYFSSSRRCPSPIPTKTPLPATPAPNSIKRSQSAERRRPATPKPTMSAAAKLLVSSTRSLSVSFQGESFAVPMGKTAKPSAPSPSLRKGTPERKRSSTSAQGAAVMTPRKGGNQGENARPFEHQPWPGRLRPITSLSRSVDLGCEGKKLINGTSAKVVRALQQSLRSGSNTNRTTRSDDELHKSMTRDELKRDGSWVNGSISLLSDTESVSSECNSGSQDSSGSVVDRSKVGGRGIMGPPKFWQESSSRLKCASDSGSPLARNNSLKGTLPPKLIPPEKFVHDSSVASPRRTVNNRGLSSPIRGSMRPASPNRMGRPASPNRVGRPASPNKVGRPASPNRVGASMASEKSSPSRGMASPARMRNPVAGVFAISSVTSTPSVLCFGADVRRVKMGDNRLGDAHLLRLLYNRHLQWRFANARAEASLSIQKISAERSLYNAWRKTSDLRGAVSSKRKELQWLRQKLKLVSILKGQMLYLEEWAVMDKDYDSSLSGAIESLRASTIRLPVVGGARAEIQDVKDAICSAADVMQAMASSICSLLLKVDEVNSLVEDVASITLKENSLLRECKDILSMLAALQVKDCSLRAHVLQLKCATIKPGC